MNVKLKDGSVRSVAEGASCAQLAKELSEGLYRNACAARVNGVDCDLRTVIRDGDTVEILTFDDEYGAGAYRHTTSHVLAQAVKRLFPDTKLAIGPKVDNGFYYDFDSSVSFTPEVLERIEEEMRRIIKEDLPLERLEMSADDALAFYEPQGEIYKLELVREHAGKGEAISFYRQGEFTELCAGPHLMSTGMIKAFKLTSCTGAYWRGSEKNKMLQRIYGTAFPKKSQLDEYLAAQEEAKKRDHNKLGRELEYFTTVDYIGQGLPILLPNGARVVQLLQRFVEDEEQRRGWQLTKTPFMAKSDLYKISGHWDHYRDGMFVLGDEQKDDEVYALRPMTCPFQYQCYLNKPRSYKDLPLRYDETSTLFRNEASGEMHGLIRVRQFTISEGHLMCRPDQLEDEFRRCLDLVIYMLKTLGLYEDVSYRFSQWDPEDTAKYIGTPEQWDEAQSIMKTILDDLGLDYKIGIGEAAFYGPKLDIQIKNVFGKEDTLITIQIDQMLAEKFDMVYTDSDGSKKNPYIIHRTSIGCYERTLALLIEKYNGAFPLWLAPEQIRVLPIADRHHEVASEVADRLEKMGFRVKNDARSEKLGYKLREARNQRIPYLLVIGDNEAADGTVSVRRRGSEESRVMTLDEFAASALADVASKVIW